MIAINDACTLLASADYAMGCVSIHRVSAAMPQAVFRGLRHPLAVCFVKQPHMETVLVGDCDPAGYLPRIVEVSIAGMLLRTLCPDEWIRSATALSSPVAICYSRQRDLLAVSMGWDVALVSYASGSFVAMVDMCIHNGYSHLIVTCCRFSADEKHLFVSNRDGVYKACISSQKQHCRVIQQVNVGDIVTDMLVDADDGLVVSCMAEDTGKGSVFFLGADGSLQQTLPVPGGDTPVALAWLRQNVYCKTYDDSFHLIPGVWSMSVGAAWVSSCLRT